MTSVLSNQSILKVIKKAFVIISLVLIINFNSTPTVLPIKAHVNITYVTEFGSSGVGPGEFLVPLKMEVNSTNLIVADAGNNRIQILDHMGNYISEFGSEGNGNGQFTNPLSFTSNDTHFFVGDFDQGRVQVFDRAGNYISDIGGFGTDPGKFSSVRGITNNDTHIFVSDRVADRVQVFDLKGNYLAAIDSPGTYGLSGILAHNGSLLFVEAGPAIDVYNSNLELVYTIGNNISESLDPIVDLSIYGKYLFVSALGNQLIIYDLEGHRLGQFGGGGTDPGQFSSIGASVINGTHLFVSDLGDMTIQIFDFELELPLTETITQKVNETETSTETISTSETTTTTNTITESEFITETTETTETVRETIIMMITTQTIVNAEVTSTKTTPFPAFLGIIVVIISLSKRNSKRR